MYQREYEIPDNIKEILVEKIYNQDWEYDLPGFIYHSELVKAIEEKHIIPQNAMLNGKTRMDAENYYFLAKKMHDMVEIYRRDLNKENDDKEDLRLKRTCPECGKWLVLRKGQNTWFWGCTGFVAVSSCKYREGLNHRRF